MRFYKCAGWSQILETSNFQSKAWRSATNAVCSSSLQTTDNIYRWHSGSLEGGELGFLCPVRRIADSSFTLWTFGKKTRSIVYFGCEDLRKRPRDGDKREQWTRWNNGYKNKFSQVTRKLRTLCIHVVVGQKFPLVIFENYYDGLPSN